MARLMIVDDSLFVRTAVARIIRNSGHEVIFEARSGDEAIRQAAILRPDLILMDLMMPGMDGCEATRRIMGTTPTRILVISSFSESGRQETLLALQAGAIDFIHKPDASNFHLLEKELSAKIDIVLGSSLLSMKKKTGGGKTQAPHPPAAGFRLIVIGASTGGPQTLARLLSPLAADFPLPIVIAQHMPKDWTRNLAQVLSGQCKIRVQEAVANEGLKGGTAYIAPGARNIEVTGIFQLRYTDRASPLGISPSADILFDSAAVAVKERVLAIVLTGMGNDGTEGARKIRKNGGTVFAQDEASCVVYGMPRSVMEDGMAHWQASTEEMAAYMKKLN